MELSRILVVQHHEHLPVDQSTYCKTLGWIFSVRSFMKSSRLVVVQYHENLFIWPIWGNPWAKTCISETTEWIFSIQSSVEFSWLVVMQNHGHLHIWPIWACSWLPILPIWAYPWARMHISQTSVWIFSGQSSMEYGPVTMIAPVSGHQVRCIPWVQMGTFNKEIVFYVD